MNKAYNYCKLYENNFILAIELPIDSKILFIGGKHEELLLPPGKLIRKSINTIQKHFPSSMIDEDPIESLLNISNTADYYRYKDNTVLDFNNCLKR